MQALLHNNTTTLWGVCTHSCEAGPIVHPRAQLERLQSEGDQLQPKFFQQQNTWTIDGGRATTPPSSLHLLHPGQEHGSSFLCLALASSDTEELTHHSSDLQQDIRQKNQRRMKMDLSFLDRFYPVETFREGHGGLCSALLQPTEICSLELTEAELALYDS